jgi:TusA-related sulfurtransferase
MKHTVDAMGKQCPIPVVMTKKILDKAEQGDEILILVDNETAVNNLADLPEVPDAASYPEKQKVVTRSI